MSVILNESALRLLLDSEQGPVGRLVERKAEEAAAAAQQNIDIIMASSFVRPRVETANRGRLGIAVGLRDEGRVSRYLDAKAAREQPGWMRSALARVFPFG